MLLFMQSEECATSRHEDCPVEEDDDVICSCRCHIIEDYGDDDNGN
jgi:hypothetical protein